AFAIPAQNSSISVSRIICMRSPPLHSTARGLNRHPEPGFVSTGTPDILTSKAMPAPPEDASASSTSAAATEAPAKKRRMSNGQRLLFFLTAWLIVLMPFLFWWNTWFGRQLSDKQITEYLRDDKHPR